MPTTRATSGAGSLVGVARLAGDDGAGAGADQGDGRAVRPAGGADGGGPGGEGDGQAGGGGGADREGRVAVGRRAGGWEKAMVWMLVMVKSALPWLPV